MTKNWTIVMAASVAEMLALLVPTFARADIYQWEYINPGDPSQGKQQSTTIAPDGAGADAVPGANLLYRNLTKAYLIGADLTNGTALAANFTNADLSQANLTNAHFFTVANDDRAAILVGANLSQANLTNADFSGYLGVGQAGEDYFYIGADLTGANLSKANLTGAKLLTATLADANLSQTTLSTSFAGVTLTGANLTGANVMGTSFNRVTIHFPYYRDFGGITPAQLYTTASYQAHNLAGIGLRGSDFAGADLSLQNLRGADFNTATLTGANLTGADIGGASFSREYVPYSYGFFGGLTPEQLYSTVSYQARDLTGVRIDRNNLAGANLANQNLTNTTFFNATITEADFSGADTRGALGLVLPESAITANLIRPDGRITGLDLLSGASLLVRDHDGNSLVSPPLGPRTIFIEQAMALDPSGRLRLVFDTDHWDSLISFAEGIPVDRGGGMLELTFAPGTDIDSQSGRTIRLFDWSGVAPTGIFNVESPYSWDLSALYTTGEVTLTSAAALGGDFNQDGTVDAADYVVWRKTNGTQEGYGTWRANFGNSLSGSGAAIPGRESSTAVPEPSAIALWLLALFRVMTARWVQKPLPKIDSSLLIWQPRVLSWMMILDSDAAVRAINRQADHDDLQFGRGLS